MQRWMGQGNAVKAKYTVSDRLAGALDITRPILSTMGALGVAGGAALAYGGFPAWSKCIIGFVAACWLLPEFILLTIVWTRGGI